MRVDRAGAVAPAPAVPPGRDRSAGRRGLRAVGRWAGAPGSGRDLAGDPPGGRLAPGLLFARLGTWPAVALAGWLLATYPLVLAGVASPVPSVLLAAPVIAVLLAATRRLPAVPDTPGWAVAATVAVAAGFAALAGATHGEHVVLRRDPAVYALTVRWLAEHGGLPVPAGFAAIGGPGGGFTAVSPGYYPRGGDLVPQFMSGTAAALLPGGWLADWGGILTLPAVYTGLALLAVAGLTARLVGPRWAPLAALALGATQPELLTARTTLSEPLAQLLLFGGLCLILDAVRRVTAGGRAGPAAAVAGLVLGLGPLIRIEAVRDVLLVIPVLGWLAARRSPLWSWLTGGLLVGAALGAVDALGPSRPYVSDLLYLIRPALVLGAAITVATVLATAVVRRYGVPDRLRRRAAAAGALGVLAGAALLVARPLLQTTHQRIDDTVPIIAGLQREQQLPVDGRRSYAEHSLHWVSWYVGWPALALAGVAAAVLVWVALRGLDDRWALALPVPLASTVLVLYRPGITPDHPWADRRLVPTVLPTVVLLGVAALAAAVAALDRGLAARAGPPASRDGPGGRGGLRRRAMLGASVLGAGLLVAPAVVATAPLVGARTELGELAAVDTACAAFAPGDVALAIDARSRQELIPVLRQLCAVPTFGVPGEPTDDSATPAEVDAAVRRVRAAGGRPVLVAQSAEPLPQLTGAPQRHIVRLVTAEHQRLLTRRAERVRPLQIELWVAAAD